jgi:predicted nucleic acid-binding Zn ribbon protein
MAVKIPPHKHCDNCNAPMALGKDFCTSECEDAFKDRIRKKRWKLLLLGAAAVALYLLAATGVFG